MINTDMREYNYFTLGAPDEYGQPQLSAEAQGSIKIAIYLTSQAITNNIKYKDSSYIGITLDKAVNDTYVIDYNGEKLKVLYVNPKGKYKQVFLSEL